MHDEATYNSGLPSHPAGVLPLDDENKARVDAARRDFENRKVGEGLSKFLNRVADEIDQIDRVKRLALFRQQIKAHQYMDGNFYGYVDQNLEWQQKTKGVDEVWYSDNQLYPYWRTALMELSRSQTEVQVNVSEGSSDEMKAAAKFAKGRYDANRERTFSTLLKQTENVYALLNGITYRYTFPQFDTGRPERMPQISQGEAEDGEEKKLCAMCARPHVDLPEISGEMPGEMPEQPEMSGEGEMAPPPQQPDPKCMFCGSSVFLSLSKAPDTIIGYEDVPTCENKWIVPNPVGVTVSLQASTIEETAYLKWKQKILRSVLQLKFPGLELPDTSNESIEMRYVENQQSATPASFYSETGPKSVTDGNELERLEFQQIWLDYPLYCHIKFDESTPLGRGQTLPAGKTLGEMFPDGLYYARTGDLICDIWNEDKNRKWTSSPYGMRPGSMYGSGSSQAISHQEILNDIETITMANAWSNGVPKEFVDPSVIKELSADPQVPTNVDMSGKQGRIIGAAYDVAPAQPLSAEIYGIADTHRSSMQNTIGALSGTGAGGLADSQKWGDTATAITIKRDLAVGRFSPDLELMADQLDRLQAYQFLENEQEYFTPEQWEKVKGETGADAMKAFLKCDIRRDLMISIAPGSFMPKSDAQIQAKAMSFAQVIPLLSQAQNPELLAYYSEIFGMPENLSGWTYDREYVGKLVKRFEALAKLFVEQYGDAPSNDLEDPQVLQVAQQINDYAKMPVDVFLDNHEAQQDALKDWRMTDVGQNASNVLLAAVALRVVTHQQAIGKQAAIVTQSQIDAQAPVQEAAAQQEQQAMEAQAPANEQAQMQAEDQAETQMQAEGLKQVGEFADRDDARSHEQDMLAAKQAHEQELATINAAKTNT